MSKGVRGHRWVGEEQTWWQSSWGHKQEPASWNRCKPRRTWERCRPRRRRRWRCRWGTAHPSARRAWTRSRTDTPMQSTLPAPPWTLPSTCKTTSWSFRSSAKERTRRHGAPHVVLTCISSPWARWFSIASRSGSGCSSTCREEEERAWRDCWG